MKLSLLGVELLLGFFISLINLSFSIEQISKSPSVEVIPVTESPWHTESLSLDHEDLFQDLCRILFEGVIRQVLLRGQPGLVDRTVLISLRIITDSDQ